MFLSHQFNLQKLTHIYYTNSNYLQPNFRFSSISQSSSLNNNSTLFNKPHKSTYFNFPLTLTRCKTKNTIISSSIDNHSEAPTQKSQEKSFWGAVSLIIGTAVGPGMLGLPSATIKSGSLPSTLSIILSWVYVISSILLVAELSFASMEEDKVGEVSFTGLATNALGSWMGILVAIIYASLSFSLIVACVSGIGSIIIQWFPLMNSILAHALFPCIVGIIIAFFPFKAIDSANRFLCFIMLFSITALIATGLSIGRAKLLGSFAHSSWALSSILPTIPVTVLTLGFHVITPFICKLVGKNIFDARNAILFGGAVPLVMVLSWNIVVLGLANTQRVSTQDPISLLLSVNSSVLPAVQGFAFSALSTSLIGYAVSFPKQLIDTLELIWRQISLKKPQLSQIGSDESCIGNVGFISYSTRQNVGTPGQISFSRSSCSSGANQGLSNLGSSSVNRFVMPIVLGAPIVIVSFFPSAFSRALDFAGVYANCFLFGVLPPVMAWIYRSRKKSRSSFAKEIKLLPGGDAVLLLLFVVAVILGIWH